MDLNHLHLLVKDLQKSKKFYSDLFDFSEKVTYGPKLLFLQNPSGFDLALTPVDDVQSLPAGVHFGFSLPSKKDVEKFYERCKELYPDNFDEEPTDNETWGSFACTDPDGYIIEVYWDSELH